MVKVCWTPEVPLLTFDVRVARDSFSFKGLRRLSLVQAGQVSPGSLFQRTQPWRCAQPTPLPRPSGWEQCQLHSEYLPSRLPQELPRCPSPLASHSAVRLRWLAADWTGFTETRNTRCSTVRSDPGRAQPPAGPDFAAGSNPQFPLQTPQTHSLQFWGLFLLLFSLFDQLDFCLVIYPWSLFPLQIRLFFLMRLLKNFLPIFIFDPGFLKCHPWVSRSRFWVKGHKQAP